MSQFDSNQLKNLTKLCRIKCTESEEQAIFGQLKKILDYVNLLQEVDTQDIEPCHHVIDYDANAFREDAICNVLPRELFLANAPDQIGGMIRIPPVLKN